MNEIKQQEIPRNTNLTKKQFDSMYPKIEEYSMLRANLSVCYDKHGYVVKNENGTLEVLDHYIYTGGTHDINVYHDKCHEMELKYENMEPIVPNMVGFFMLKPIKEGRPVAYMFISGYCIIIVTDEVKKAIEGTSTKEFIFTPVWYNKGKNKNDIVISDDSDYWEVRVNQVASTINIHRYNLVAYRQKPSICMLYKGVYNKLIQSGADTSTSSRFDGASWSMIISSKIANAIKHIDRIHLSPIVTYDQYYLDCININRKIPVGLGTNDVTS